MFWIVTDTSTYLSLTLGRGLDPAGFEAWIRNFCGKTLLHQLRTYAALPCAEHVTAPPLSAGILRFLIPTARASAHARLILVPAATNSASSSTVWRSWPH